MLKKYDIEIETHGDTLIIEVLELSKKQKKQIQNKYKSISEKAKEIQLLSQKANRIKRDVDIVKEKAQALDGKEKIAQLEVIEKLNAEFDKIEDIITNTSMEELEAQREAIFKDKLEMSVQGLHREAFLKAAEAVGYEEAYNVVAEKVVKAEKK